MTAVRSESARRGRTLDQALVDDMYSPSALAVVGFVTFLAASAMLPVARRLASRVGAIDRPDARRVHAIPTPRMGGVAVIAVTAVAWGVLSLLPAVPGDGALLPTLSLLAALLCLVGGVDDVLALSSRRKLLATVVAAAVPVTLGLRIELLALPWLPEIALGPASIPITVLWLVAVTHAVNLIDGLDGLATTVAIVVLAGVAASDVAGGTGERAFAAVALGGALFAFLRINWYPARMFLGDCGALPLGGVLGVLSLAPASMDGTALRWDAAALLLLAYPVFDTSLAIVRRWLRAIPLSAADRHHVHHRLLARGMRQPWPAVAIGSWSALSVLLALASRHEEWGSLLGVVAGVIAVMLFTIGIVMRLEYVEFQALGACTRSVMRQAREVVRDRIRLREAAAELSRMESLDEVERRLADAATGLGFLHATITRSSARRNLPDTGGLPVERIWHFDWPLALDLIGSDTDPVVLRVYGPRNEAAERLRPDRLVRELGPALEGWFDVSRRQLLQRRLPGRRASADGLTDRALRPVRLAASA